MDDAAPLPAGARRAMVIGATALLLLVVLAVVAVAMASAHGGHDRTLSARQHEVEVRGAQVMPFDQSRTTHVFRAMRGGGVQVVTANDPGDAAQVRMIREHLTTEAARFRAGNFSDPAAIHGPDMPGLAALEAGASRVRVEYSDIADGARITYTTGDPGLVRALHDWFDAQLTDHGAHAQS